MEFVGLLMVSGLFLSIYIVWWLILEVAIIETKHCAEDFLFPKQLQKNFHFNIVGTIITTIFIYIIAFPVVIARIIKFLFTVGEK